MDKGKKNTNTKKKGGSVSSGAESHYFERDELQEEMDNFWEANGIQTDASDPFAEDEPPEFEGLSDLENRAGEDGEVPLTLEEEEEIQRQLALEEEEEMADLAEEMADLQEEKKEKLILDRINVELLISMVSKVKLAWPEDLPGYDAAEYATDPERAKFRESYFHNTDKEKTVLWHAENFRRQFKTQFPKRRAMIIAPPNECGTQKLFPTYLNPIVMGYPEFLDAESMAQYLKEFFAPEIMEPPTHTPSRFQSHLTALKNRKVSAFEFASIMCMFLIGAGYDAYVVDGYASKSVTTMDATEDYLEPETPPEVDLYNMTETLDREERKKKASLKPQQQSTINIDNIFAYWQTQEEEEEVVERPTSPSKYRFKKKPAPGTEFDDNDDVGISIPTLEQDETKPEDAAKPGDKDKDGEEEEEEDDEEETKLMEQSELDAKKMIDDMGFGTQPAGEEEEDEEEEEWGGEGEEIDEAERRRRERKKLLAMYAEEAAEDEAEWDENEEEEEEEEYIYRRPRPWCPEKYYGIRTHAWVLIKPGTMDVETPFFIEPFSGTKTPITEEAFHGVEAVFNHRNYWMNLQDPQENFVDEISWNLDDPSKWAKFLIEPEKRKKKVKTVNSNGELDDEEDDEPPRKVEFLLDMPTSWTPDPEISQEDYERKYPGGKKTFNYNDAIVELAAPYVNEDGMVRKVLKFTGSSRDPDDLLYILERFAHRRDKLRKRHWFRDGRLLHEYFEKGRKDALKEHVHISGRNRANYPRDLYYYANAHPQCVAHRQILSRGMIEHFEDRDDKLYFRYIEFGAVVCDPLELKKLEEQKKLLEQEAEEGPCRNSRARELLEMLQGGTGATGTAKRVRRRIIKIIEKYHRNEEIDAKDDIAEKHMLIDEGKIRVLFQYGVGELTRHTLEFFKPRGVKIETADFHAEDCVEYLPDPNVPPTDVYQRYKIIQQMERDQRVSLVLAAASEEQVFTTVTGRVQEDFRHEMEEYMRFKDQNVQKDQEEQEEDLSEVDFVTPFIERYGIPKSKMEEVLLKKRIMLHAKVVLLKRANAMREAFDREAAHLQEKLRWHDRHIEKLNVTQEEDFHVMYKERLFAMHVLEKRLLRHREMAPRRYYELLVKILKHPLLNKFSNKKIPPDPPKAPSMTDSERARLAALLAAKKDCCQFYTIKYQEPKKKRKKKHQDDDEEEEMGETASVATATAVPVTVPLKAP